MERKVELGRDKADTPWVETEWLVCAVYDTNISVLYFLFGNELNSLQAKQKRYAPAQFSPSPCPSVVGPLRIQGRPSEPSVHSWPWELTGDARTPLRHTVLPDLGQRCLLRPAGLVNSAIKNFGDIKQITTSLHLWVLSVKIHVSDFGEVESAYHRLTSMVLLPEKESPHLLELEIPLRAFLTIRRDKA